MVEVVEGVSEIFTMVAGLKNIHIAVEIPEDRMEVRADIDMIKTVIRNLISNAIKFSNEGSEVLVSLREEDSMAIVSVKDSGCGIDEENQKKLLHTDTHFSTFGTNNEEGSDSDCCSVRTLLLRTEVSFGSLRRKEKVLRSVSRFRCWKANISSI